MYLVMLCSTMSAPSSSGFWQHGVAKVLSTTTRLPLACAAAASTRTSMSFSVGLVGVSIHTSLCASATCPAACWVLHRSRMSTCTSIRGWHTLLRRR